MTKKDLAAKMIEFLLTLDDKDKDDWYDTARGFAADGVYKLAEYLGIQIPEYPKDPQ